MTQSQPQEAYAGQFYQDSPSLNLHTLVNYLTTKPTKFEPSAQITRVVQFPDVSFYQGDINYSIMCMQTEAIIIRAGQNLWVDTKFERNYIEAKKCGKKVGVYWFYDDRIDPGRQAALLISLLAGKKFEMEVFIDWENSYGGGFGGLANVVAMMQAVESAKNNGLIDIKDVGLYTGYYWFRGHSNATTNASQYNYLKNKPLWLAWYTSNPDNVLIPAPWTKLNHWQFGTPTVNWGQETREIDMNFFNGTRLEFNLRYELGEQPPMSDTVKLEPNSATNRSIRRPTNYPTVPHIIGTSFSTLLAGTSILTGATDFYKYVSNVTYNGVVQAYANDIWWKVLVNGEEGWIAEIHKGVRYLTVTPVDTTPPTDLPILTIQVSDTEGLYIPVTVELRPK